MAAVPDLLADAIRRTAPTQTPTSVLGTLMTIEVERDATGVITGAASVTVNIGGDVFNVNGVLAPFNRSVVTGVVGGVVVQCNFIGGQLIIADVVLPVGD